MTGPVLVEALDNAGNVIAHGTSPYPAVAGGRPGADLDLGRPARARSRRRRRRCRRPSTEMALDLRGRARRALHRRARQHRRRARRHRGLRRVHAGHDRHLADEKARAGGVARRCPTGVQAVVYGGATSTGFGTATAVDGTLELFDPTVGLGVWAALGIDSFRRAPIRRRSCCRRGAIVVTGGEDASGTALVVGGADQSDGHDLAGHLASPMVAPRVYHAAAAAKFPDGDGAMLFGGLPTGTTGAPVAERLLGQAFATYDVGAQENRLNATATTMPNGDVLVLGGKTATGRSPAGLVITPTSAGADGDAAAERAVGGARRPHGVAHRRRPRGVRRRRCHRRDAGLVRRARHHDLRAQVDDPAGRRRAAGTARRPWRRASSSSPAASAPTARRCSRSRSILRSTTCPSCPTSPSTSSASPIGWSARRSSAVRLGSPFLLRSVEPPLAETFGKRVVAMERLGKRIVFVLEDELFLVLHLMVAGRLKWARARRQDPRQGRAGRVRLLVGHAAADARRRRRSGRRCTWRAGAAALAEHDRGGLEPLEITARRVRARRCDARTTRSSARSPTRASSPASATPTPTRSCIAPSSRRWRCRRS